MALEAPLSADAVDNHYWYDFDNTYFKVDPDYLYIDFKKNRIKFGVRGFASAYARENDGLSIYKKVFEVPLPTDGSINLGDKDAVLTYCYEHLKTLPEFSNSKDV